MVLQSKFKILDSAITRVARLRTCNSLTLYVDELIYPCFIEIFRLMALEIKGGTSFLTAQFLCIFLLI